MSVDAVQQAALDAAPSPENSPIMRIAKDVTIYAAKGLGSWWEVTAGPAPKLLRYIIEIARDRLQEGEPKGVDPFDFWTTDFEVSRHSQDRTEEAREHADRGSFVLQSPPAIMDYWALTTVHQEMDLADVFVGLVLEKTRPRLIISASEKVGYSRKIRVDVVDLTSRSTKGSSDVGILAIRPIPAPRYQQTIRSERRVERGSLRLCTLHAQTEGKRRQPICRRGPRGRRQGDDRL